MPDLEVATSEGTYAFSEGDVVTIGRRDDNRVIVADPTVSRQHAVVRFEAEGWVLEDLTGGRTFLDGEPVARVVLTGAVRLALSSPTGPFLTLTAAPAVEEAAAPAAGPLAGAAATPVTATMAEPDAFDTVARPGGTPGPHTDPMPAAAAGAAGSAVGATTGAAAASTGWPGGPPSAQWQPYRPGAALDEAPAQRPAARGGLTGDQVKRALQILVPYRSWVENRGLRSSVRVLFLVYAMLPVVFLVAFLNTTNFQTLGWVYAIYTAPLWLLAFWYLIKPENSKRTLAITGAAVAAIVLLIMAGPLQWYYNAIPDPSKHPGNWFGWLLAPGIAEEMTKDLPVLLVVLVAGTYFKTQLGERLGVRSCMFLGTVAGLAFGAREAALYQDKDLTAFGLTTGPHALVQYVLEFSLRIFTDGLQHAEWAGIACFFIGLGLNYTRRRIPLILFGYGFGAIIHATNDWSTSESSWLWVALQVLWAVLFLGYTLFAPDIEAQVRATSLFRGQSLLAEQAAFGADGNPVPPGGSRPLAPERGPTPL